MDSRPIPLLSNDWSQPEPPLPIPAAGEIGGPPGYGAQIPQYSLTYRRLDLMRICQRLRTREQYFGEALVPEEALENLDQAQIRSTIQALSSKVEELAQRVRLPTSDLASSEFVLRSPPHLYQLLYLVDFFGMPIERQVFFQNKRLAERVIDIFKHQVKETTHVLHLAEELHVPYPRKTPTHIRLTSAFIQKLESEVDSVEYLNQLLEQTVIRSSSLVKERLSLLSPIRQSIKFKIAELSRFFVSSLLLSFQRFLDEEPSFDREQEWIRTIVERFEVMKPYLRIVECIQEFLAPYLEGKIFLETEDRSRAEIRQWLIPIIRYEFPNFEARDEEIETIALSTYLGMGARGLNLQRCITMLAESAQAEGADLAQLQRGTKRERSNWLKNYPMTQQAVEEELIVMGSYHLYLKALRHSLRIDFHSLNLQDNEVELLAVNQYMNPGVPLGSEWRIELGMQTLTRSSS